jgi:hypothetical protein
MKLNETSMIMITSPDYHKKSHMTSQVYQPLTARKAVGPYLFNGLKSSMKMHDNSAESSGIATPHYNYALPMPVNSAFSPRPYEKKIVVKPGGFVSTGNKTPNPSRQVT